jgi:hypothetical protein
LGKIIGENLLISVLRNSRIAGAKAVPLPFPTKGKSLLFLCGTNSLFKRNQDEE